MRRIDHNRNEKIPNGYGVGEDKSHQKKAWKNPLRCISNQMCGESAAENPKEKSAYPYQKSNGSIKSCRKAFEGHHLVFETLPRYTAL